jgi:hypothetical protein
MILYFDNLITDIPLFKGAYSELDAIRDSDSSYRKKDRYAITLYTLISYAEIKWSEVIIKYEFDPDDKKKRREFEKFVKKLWPRAHIIYGRSDNQKKFQETMKLINSFKDEWVFYAGNNDHPFVAPDTKLLNKCLDKAKDLRKKYKYVSIIYSHHPEPLHMAREGNALHDIGYPYSQILEETEDYVVSLFFRGFYTSNQILHKDLINHWLFSKDFGDFVIKRVEYGHKFVKTKNQMLICPKKEVLSHFDGYGQTKGTGCEVPSSVVPTLFLPEGFFEKKIKIAYGYPEYRKGWVNINPLKKKYSFEDNINGTDLMITLKDIPLFWKKRIKKIDINENISMKKLKEARDRKFNKIENIYLQRDRTNTLYYEFFVFYHRIKGLNLYLKNTSKAFKALSQKLNNLKITSWS